MKKSIQLFLGACFAFLIFSCDPPQDPATPTPLETPDQITGTVTPVGTADGPVITAKIGPAGGTIASADKRVQIAIPAGALTAEQTVSVQPISNQCPAGTGAAFRLLPHGISFAKPATVTFHYTEEDIRGSAPELLRIAFQDEKGIWQSSALKSIDTSGHFVSVQTTHFSDWAIFQSICISPYHAVLSPGGNVRLKASCAIPIGTFDNSPMVAPFFLPAKYIDKWALNGEGVLTHDGSDGYYQAPNWTPDINPAAVSLSLNKSVTIDGQVFKDIRLVANIFVAPEGLSIQLDGGDWRNYAAAATINSSHHFIQGKDGAEFATIGWVGGPSGTFHWVKGTDVTFNLNKPKRIYQHLHGLNLAVSGGALMVNNTDKNWVTGTFTVLPAGWIDVSSGKPEIGIASVKGVFRVQRVK
jgi:hypothetical protein